MPNGTSRYSDYCSYGDLASPARAFRPLNKLSSGSPTSEEIHYHFDSAERLTNAAFAQTPQSGHNDYTASYPAATRARAYYAYDPTGRTTSLEHYWDTWTGSTYTSEPILGNSCSYELTSLNRGVKTESDFYVNNSGSWALDHSELYGYDSSLDYLTSASYDGGSTSTAWSYDAAGNRDDATVVDNLNRATMIGGVSRTYDILGNTLTLGSSESMTWDCLSRMMSFTSGSTTTNYAYRADGMRTSKYDGTTSTLFYYGGQMPMETSEISGSSIIITRNCIGARGLDRIERTSSSGTMVAYPTYDAHGNMIATISKSGSTFTINDQRFYDIWGNVRLGATAGDPKGRYCANIGHVSDDESSLIYMRARYYEPSSGRFTSQDPDMQGSNWYSYCENDPNRVDSSGKEWHFADDFYYAIGFALFNIGKALIRAGWGLLFVSAGAFYAAGEMQFESGAELAKAGASSGMVKAARAVAVGWLCTFIGNLYMALGSDADEFLKSGLETVTSFFDSIFGDIEKFNKGRGE